MRGYLMALAVAGLGGTLAAIQAMGVTLASTGRTSLTSASASVPAGNMVTVTNASSSLVPLEYTI